MLYQLSYSRVGRQTMREIGRFQVPVGVLSKVSESVTPQRFSESVTPQGL